MLFFTSGALFLTSTIAATFAAAAVPKPTTCGGPSKVACATRFACIAKDAGTVANSNVAPKNNETGYCHPLAEMGDKCGGFMLLNPVCDSNNGLKCVFKAPADAGGVCRHVVSEIGASCGGFLGAAAPQCDETKNLKCYYPYPIYPDASGFCLPKIDGHYE